LYLSKYKLINIQKSYELISNVKLFLYHFISRVYHISKSEYLPFDKVLYIYILFVSHIILNVIIIILIFYSLLFLIKISDNSMKSFVDIAEDSDFSIQNLPYGIFSTADSVCFFCFLLICINIFSMHITFDLSL